MHRTELCLTLIALLVAPKCGAQSAPNAADWRDQPTVATFSIVARDPVTGALGVAVQSRVAAVGAVVPYAKAGIGAIATQAQANPRYGPEGLALLESGRSAKDTVTELTKADAASATRQLGMVDAKGNVAAFTGDKCNAFAGHHEGKDFCCQGNILAGAAVVTDMAKAFEDSAALPFSERLLLALEAAQQAGGDRRGMQSAAILVVRTGGGYGGGNDRFIDLRVDDHEQPIAELRRVYGVFSRGMLTGNLQRLVRESRDHKDTAAVTADLHLMLRSIGRLPREVTEAEQKALRDHLTAHSLTDDLAKLDRK